MIMLALLAALLAGCGPAALPGGSAASGGDTISPVFAFSEAVVGRNRIAIGLLKGGTPVNDPNAQVRLRFFDLNDPSAAVKGEANATYFGQGLPAAVYVAYPTLATAGDWGVEVQVQLAGQARPSTSKLRLEVLPKSAVPNIGDRAIPVKTPTVASVPDPSHLSSGKEIDPAMYQISLDDALTSGKPTALLFATPVFCRTATCGPSLQVMQELQNTYGDRINFIHAEVYRYPFADSFDKINKAGTAAVKQNRPMTADEIRAGFSDAMVAWGLLTEPWLYLIDTNGTIAARFEGGITREDLGPILDKLAAGKPLS
jgi:hypothetical protein